MYWGFAISFNSFSIARGLLCVTIGLAPGFALAQTSAEDPVEPSPVVSPIDYSGYSHHELTEVGARWDDLDAPARQALLREVKLRMARRPDAKGVLQIRTQRRYGRIVRRSDGRVLRIETQVVTVQPVNPGQGNRSFGVGFERRSSERNQTQEVSESRGADGEASPPVLRVKDQRH